LGAQEEISGRAVWSIGENTRELCRSRVLFTQLKIPKKGTDGSITTGGDEEMLKVWGEEGVMRKGI